MWPKFNGVSGSSYWFQGFILFYFSLFFKKKLYFPSIALLCHHRGVSMWNRTAFLRRSNAANHSYPSFNTRHMMMNISCCLPGCLRVHVGCSEERQQTGGWGFRRQCAQMKDSACLSSPKHETSLEEASNTDPF